LKQERLKQNEIASSFEPWALKKSSILAKYTTLEKLSITSSFLTPIAGTMMKEKAVAAASVTQTDKIKNRLEQLEQYDNDENLQEMSNLSQQEYVKRIDELNNALQVAWAEDDRVKSLKIVIQVRLIIQLFNYLVANRHLIFDKILFLM
jgi:protein subunit release factor A